MEFETVYTTYWPKIFRLCMGYVNDEAWAKDITQETFIIVWQQLHTFRHEAGISTWIFRIASNLCLRQTEKEKRLPVATVISDVPEPATTGIEQQTAFLYTCIAELAETDRLIISLELEDVRQAEIARITGLSEQNIRVKIHRIKEKLTQKFKQYEG